MKRGGQPARLYAVDLTVAVCPIQLSVPVDLIEHPKTIVQVDQVGAAPHQHVLAVVDDLTASWIDEAGRSSTQDLSGLDDDRLAVGVGKLQGRGDPRQAPADDRDASSQSEPFPVGWPNHLARIAINPFRHAPRRTRLLVIICDGSSSIFFKSEP